MLTSSVGRLRFSPPVVLNILPWALWSSLTICFCFRKPKKRLGERKGSHCKPHWFGTLGKGLKTAFLLVESPNRTKKKKHTKKLRGHFGLLRKSWLVVSRDDVMSLKHKCFPLVKPYTSIPLLHLCIQVRRRVYRSSDCFFCVFCVFLNVCVFGFKQPCVDG